MAVAYARSVQEMPSQLQDLLRISGLQPSYCGEPTEEEVADYREAYNTATSFVDENPASNICTIGADYRVKCWQATEFPVKL